MKSRTNWEKYVIEAFDAHPANLTNNTLCWISIIEALYEEEGLTPPRDFLYRILINQLPTSHVIAAAISNVKTKYPQYTDPELKKLKDQYKKDWINQRNEYLNK